MHSLSAFGLRWHQQRYYLWAWQVDEHLETLLLPMWSSKQWCSLSLFPMFKAVSHIVHGSRGMAEIILIKVFFFPMPSPIHCQQLAVIKRHVHNKKNACHSPHELGLHLCVLLTCLMLQPLAFQIQTLKNE